MRSIVRNKMKWLILILLLPGIIAACGGSEGEAEPAAETEVETVVETVVVVATPTAEEAAAPPEEAPEETAVSADTPALEAPTAAPGEPTVTALVDLNIRTGPGTHYQAIGALRANSSARILGRSSGGHWWKIECPSGYGSECWLSAGAQYSQAADAANVPVAAAPPAPAQATQVADAGTAATATATATATGAAAGGNTPTATATLAAGQLTATATATTGANQPTATATATTGANQPTATATATTAANQPTATATATATATEETAGQQIAPFDNDSLQNPAVSVFLRPTGTRNFTYSNDISYPDGDQDDWVEFEFPNNSNTNQVVWLTLECNIVSEENVQVIANISENGVATTKRAFCNNGETQLTVDNTKVQQVRIYFNITGEAYATYTLTVVGFR